MGAMFATNIAGYSLFGMEGWRAAFRTVAVAAMLIGVLVLVCVKDPRYREVPRVRDYFRVGSRGLLGTGRESRDSVAERTQKQEDWKDVVADFWLVRSPGKEVPCTLS